MRHLDDLALFRSLLLIRRFEETLLENFARGVFSGTTHTSLGQEANAVGVLSQLNPDDIVFSNHRCHGHFLAYGGDVQALYAELMGKRTGVCGGRGGSQHLHWRNFYSNGIQGGIVPQAVGMALAEKQKNQRMVTVVFLGDGTLGEGVVYEALNLAALWEAPVLFVLENNHIAQTTPVELALAGDMPLRFRAFGIPVDELDTSDVKTIQAAAAHSIELIRSEQKPRALLLHTNRFGPHSKGDDTRPEQTLEDLRLNRDPIRIQSERISVGQRMLIEAEVEHVVQHAYLSAQADPPATLLETGAMAIVPITHMAAGEPSQPKQTVLESLNAGLKRALAADERVYLLGEDVLDPYGGAFKVTRGLSSAFPGRVWTTPISEAGITGVAGGMALRGLRPIVEIMFGDFSTLIADQVINHLSKFRWMYNEQVSVPVVIRTPMGGRRGYGPTHSQSLEKLYLGIPGLRILAPSSIGDPGMLLEETILRTEEPVLFTENKLLYSLPILQPNLINEFSCVEVPHGYLLHIQGAPAPAISIAAYGYMAELCRQAMLRLAYENEIFAELYVPIQLAPYELDPLFQSLSKTRRLLTAEEGTLCLGWGAELSSRAAERLGGHLQAVRRVAGLDLPIPAAATLERLVLPGVEQIKAAAIELSMV